ncbi:hypothetical protein BBJ29_008498 [Phytophthora kernoviae]|uniref:SCP domain-containing protein n=1 Tax=Phytophthora kernoviae TaxID=325452 RepID=A0A3F2RDL4_9STRA|nr:hypothetical protein BBJ29_008498 [Phytophthora kernoviae]RLN54030.1 hypothetical protein BBP00_00009088 [Phytophthora kernoviae]
MKGVFSPSNVITLSALVACVQAHGYISKPKASYKPNTIYTTYNRLTDASVNKGFSGGHYNWSPEQNVQAFTDHWKATGYKSLRDMLDPLSPGYGFSLETADPVDVSNVKEMWWQNDEYKEGFLESHHGPCEGWVDGKMVFHYDDCVAKFPSYPAKIPTDYSSCKGDCLFVFYWLALHQADWQIYKQCVPITNGGSGQKEVAGEASTFTEATQPPQATQATPTAPSTPLTVESGSCQRRMRS